MPVSSALGGWASGEPWIPAAFFWSFFFPVSLCLRDRGKTKTMFVKLASLRRSHPILPPGQLVLCWTHFTEEQTEAQRGMGHEVVELGLNTHISLLPLPAPGDVSPSLDHEGIWGLYCGYYWSSQWGSLASHHSLRDGSSGLRS